MIRNETDALLVRGKQLRKQSTDAIQRAERAIQNSIVLEAWGKELRARVTPSIVDHDLLKRFCNADQENTPIASCYRIGGNATANEILTEAVQRTNRGNISFIPVLGTLGSGKSTSIFEEFIPALTDFYNVPREQIEVLEIEEAIKQYFISIDQPWRAGPYKQHEYAGASRVLKTHILEAAYREKILMVL